MSLSVVKIKAVNLINRPSNSDPIDSSKTFNIPFSFKYDFLTLGRLKSVILTLKCQHDFGNNATGKIHRQQVFAANLFTRQQIRISGSKFAACCP